MSHIAMYLSQVWDSITFEPSFRVLPRERLISCMTSPHNLISLGFVLFLKECLQATQIIPWVVISSPGML
jgi:hypothetical protein